MQPRPSLKPARTGIANADAIAAEVTTHELAVLEAIRATPYGSVEIVLHQSRIVQVVRTEKMKLDTTLAGGC